MSEILNLSLGVLDREEPLISREYRWWIDTLA